MKKTRHSKMRRERVYTFYYKGVTKNEHNVSGRFNLGTKGRMTKERLRNTEQWIKNKHNLRDAIVTGFDLLS